VRCGATLLRGPVRDASAERLTCYLGEINAIHPFREGDGQAGQMTSSRTRNRLW